MAAARSAAITDVVPPLPPSPLPIDDVVAMVVNTVKSEMLDVVEDNLVEGFKSLARGAIPRFMLLRTLGGIEGVPWCCADCENSEPLRSCCRLGISTGVARISATLGNSVRGVFPDATEDNGTWGVSPRPPVRAF